LFIVCGAFAVGFDEKAKKRAGGASAEFRDLGRDDHVYLAWSWRAGMVGFVGTIVCLIVVYLGIGHSAVCVS
jgi:hypothetical protein